MKKSRSPKKSEKEEIKSTNDNLKKGSEESVFENDSSLDSTTNTDSSNFEISKSTELKSQGVDAENNDNLNNQSFIPKSIRKTEQLLINIIQKTTVNSPTRAFVMNVGGATLFFIYNAN
ncbi:MAG: hypothetical protein KBH11_07625 [Bacteroidia bacterium]|nr:hypothetical protein [Bacteroidota bacterium]MBP9082929.1 hypothetical protein [Bacteroidia bacterium]